MPAAAIGINGSAYTAVSLEAWVSSTNINAFRYTAQAMFGGSGPTQNSGAYVLMQATREPLGQGSRVAITNSGFLGERGVTNGASDLLDALPHHMVMTVTYPGAFGVPGTLSYYLDGALVGSTSNSVTRASLSSELAYLGKSLFADPLLQGSIHEFSIYNNALTASEVSTNFTAGPVGGAKIGPRIEVNRATGEVKLLTDTAAPVRILSYVIASTAGALNSANSASIANTGDADNGGGFDPDDFWTITEQMDTKLQEETFGLGGDIIAATPRSLGTGVWRRSRFENLTAAIRTDAGVNLGVPVLFTGGPAISRSDSNADGSLTAADYLALSANFQLPLTGQNDYENWQQRDVDGDGLNDFNDFRLFQIDYTAAN